MTILHSTKSVFALPSPGWRWLWLISLWFGLTGAALANSYTDNGDGTVTDPATGLIWARCAVGQSWTGSSCAGTAALYAWDEAKALFNGTSQSDWRVPNVRELQTLVDRSSVGPAIQSGTFPNTPNAHFWSSTAHATSAYVSNASVYTGPYLAWYVNFYSGYANSAFGLNKHMVRPVRGGTQGLLDTTRPNASYVDPGDGTVLHSPTGLVWQRCAVGQSWSGGTCVGSASRFSWDAAKQLSSNFAGRSDWRLPTQAELGSLVDYTRYSPALNTTMFPGAPIDYFWSASPYAFGSSFAWYLHSNDGEANSSFSASEGAVRLVRAGQSFGSFALTVAKSGTGSGTVSSSPAGISCGITCSASYASGTSVTLSASAAAGNTFTGWSGACTGTSICVVSMSAATSVIATFSMTVPGAPSILSITPGPGRVTLTLLAPGNTGGGAIVSYSATCSASGHPTVTASSTTTTVVVSGLVPGASYACIATASNGSYTSLASAATSAIPKPKADLTPILMLLLD